METPRKLKTLSWRLNPPVPTVWVNAFITATNLDDSHGSSLTLLVMEVCIYIYKCIMYVQVSIQAVVDFVNYL